MDLNRNLTKPGRCLFMVFLVSTLLVIFVGAACQHEPQHEPAQPERELPAMVTPGEEFEVTVTFTSPHDTFHAI